MGKIKPKFELWELRVNGYPINKITTLTKRERKILTQLRKIFLELDYANLKYLELSNRINRTEKIVKLNQEAVLKKQDLFNIKYAGLK